MTERSSDVRYSDSANARPHWNKEEIWGMLGHDLRTPLSGVRGYLDLLGTTALSVEQSEYVATALQCTNDLQAMLEGILECARIDSGEFAVTPEPTDLKHLLEKALSHFDLLNTNGVILVLDIPPDFPPSISLDRVKVSQIINNLVSNSIKFTRRGNITVRADAAPAPASTTSAGIFQLVVEDSGIGIDEEHLRHVFNPFYRCEKESERSSHGTGLGLAIVEKLVTTLEGSVAVKSTVGSGTTVTVRLPFHD